MKSSFLPLLPLLSLVSLTSAQFEESHVRLLLDVTGGSAGDLFAWRVVTLGDVSGDGVSDFAVAVPFDDVSFGIQTTGSIYAISGADGATLWTRSETLASAVLGYALETLDWNGDGELDVVASGPFSASGGRVWVYSGLDGSTLAVLNAATSSDGFGASVATGGDFDGDGNDDLAVSAPFADTATGTRSGRIDVYAKGSGALLATLDGPGPAAEFGLGLAFIGDLTQPSDGRDELVVGYRLASFVDGEAVVLSSTSPAPLYTVTGIGMGPDIIGDRIDASGDVTGDGIRDIFVGDLSFDTATLVSGATGLALYTLDGGGVGGNFGTGHIVPDLDHDGRADVAVGAWAGDVGAADSGRIFLYSGASGSLLKTITPTDVDRGLGCDVRAIDDFDGDGRIDLVVGAYGNGGVGLPRGRLQVFSGHIPAPNNQPAPAELASDPILLDNGGDPASGPLIASAFEPFNVALDCTGFPSGAPYFVQGREDRLVTPTSTPFGSLWMGGTRLFLFAGTHSGGVVEAAPGGFVLPADLALVGLDFTVQGGCMGAGLRLSNALTQTIGN
jgi:hypothetical protein